LEVVGVRFIVNGTFHLNYSVVEIVFASAEVSHAAERLQRVMRDDVDSHCVFAD
jgi:hypothetical protein